MTLLPTLAPGLPEALVTKPGLTAARQRTVGLLDLRFSLASDARRTKLTVTAQQPPLRVIRAFPLDDGGVLVHLHNVSGGILGGDQLTVSACLEESTQVQLTSTGATRVYRHRPGYADATQWTTFTVGKDALLEYLPDPLIPFAAARFRQQTRIALAEGAGLFYWEVIAPGRAAHNELFAYEEVALQLEISAIGQPILFEHSRLQPAVQPLTAPARMGAYRYVGAFYICKVGLSPDAWLALEEELMTLAHRLSVPGEMRWGVSTMPAHGLVVRTLSMSNRAITDGLLHFWQHAKAVLYGRKAILPRKVY
jgi:urease accessory protein